MTESNKKKKISYMNHRVITKNKNLIHETCDKCCVIKRKKKNYYQDEKKNILIILTYL